MTNPPTEIERKRAEWLAEYYKPGMSFGEMVRLNNEVMALCPPTSEERAQEVKDRESVPEFVL